MSVIKGLSAVFIAVSIFFAGWTANGWRCSAKWSEFEAQAAHKALEEVQKSQTIESSWRELADMAAQQTQKDYEEINEKYKSALARIDDLGLELDRLHEQRSDSANPMPKTTSTSIRVNNSCKCRSSRSHGRGVEEALTIARDCDVLATKYNRLLQFYEDVRFGK